MVDGNYGGLGAGPQAGIEPHRQPAVRGLSLFFHSGGIEHRVYQGHGAQQVTGGAPAKLHLVVGRRLEAEIGVERGHGPHIVDGGPGENGYLTHRFPGYVTQLILHGQQGGENGDGGLGLAVDRIADSLSQPIHQPGSLGGLVNGREVREFNNKLASS